jgi:hypothetical protein
MYAPLSMSRQTASSARTRRGYQDQMVRMSLLLLIVRCESAGLVVTASTPAGRGGHCRLPVLWLKECHRTMCRRMLRAYESTPC